MGELADRRKRTTNRIEELVKLLKPAERLAAGNACVYATGSFGRCEASTVSDLDLFILSKSKPVEDDRLLKKHKSLLNGLDEICIKAKLIAVTRKLKIPDFSGGGRYLSHYSVTDLTETLGTSEDDVTNTFTARLLLLLESRPLVGSTLYDELVWEVLAAYWRDYPDHEDKFIPAFLANDILRLWRTFCVNYEAGTERVPEAQKAKGKLKNYKLKHSRLLTCYSAILCLLAVYRQKKTVTQDDTVTIIHRTPTERLEWLLEQSDLRAAHSDLKKLLDQYERFLRTTNRNERELVNQFADKEQSGQYMGQAYEFGDTLYDVLTKIGNGNRFHRLLVV